MVSAPVLLIVTVPPVASLRPVTDRVVVVLVRLMLPLVLFEALNELRVLAPASVMPVPAVAKSVATVRGVLCVMAPPLVR